MLQARRMWQASNYSGARDAAELSIPALIDCLNQFHFGEDPLMTYTHNVVLMLQIVARLCNVAMPRVSERSGTLLSKQQPQQQQLRFCRLERSEMARVYIGNLEARVTERDLEDAFRAFGVIRRLWVARRPPGPGFAFLEFDDIRDAQHAIGELDGKNGWRVELSHDNRDGSGGGRGRDGGGRSGGGRGRSGGSDHNCYECGETGNYARECRSRGGGGRRRSRSPVARYRRSPSYGRRNYSPRSLPPVKRYRRGRSTSPHGRGASLRVRSISPRGRGYSRSPPPYRRREEVPAANGNGIKDRHGSRS